MLGTRGDSTSLGRVGRARVVGSALVVVVLGATWLSGCESDAVSPPPMETSTRSPSATPSPTPTAPALPAEAKGTTEASAEAFVRHYFDVLRYSMNSGNISALRALSGDACESCRAIISNIEGTYAAGGSISSRGWIIQSTTFVPGQPSRRPIIDLGIQISPERIVRRAGAESETFSGGKQPMTMYLVHAKGQWVVVRLDRVQ